MLSTNGKISNPTSLAKDCGTSNIPFSGDYGMPRISQMKRSRCVHEPSVVSVVNISQWMISFEILNHASLGIPESTSLSCLNEQRSRISLQSLTLVSPPLYCYQAMSELITIAGSGKTLIAVLLLRYILDQELEDRAMGKKPRVAFFLVKDPLRKSRFTGLVLMVFIGGLSGTGVSAMACPER